MLVAGGSTDVTTYFALRLAADGTAATGLTITNFDLQYVRSGAAPSIKADATALVATDSAHGDNQAIEIDATDQPGLYRVDWPDAAFAAGVREVILTVKVATAFTEHFRVEIDGEVNVVEWAGTDVVAGAIPAAAADAAGGLPTSDAGGLDIDTLLGTLTSLAAETRDANVFDQFRTTRAVVEHQRGAHTHQPIGNIFFVDPTNGDTHANGNRGGITDPYSLVQDCHDNAVTDSNHDMIILLSGAAAGATTLSEAVTLTKRYLFIRGPGRDFIWTRGTNGDTITITADGVELSGFQIGTAGTGVGNGVTVTSADFFRAQHVWVGSTQGHGIQLTNVDNAQILHSHFHDTGQSGAGHGLVLDAGTGQSGNNIIIEDNHFHSVAGDSIRLNPTGTGTINDAVIRRNHITNSSSDGIEITGAGANRAVIAFNTIGGSGGSDINDSGTGTVAENNEQWAQHSIATELRLAELDAANMPADIDGITGFVDGIMPAKNADLANVEFLMVDSTDHVTPKTGLTVTVTRSIDGGAFAAKNAATAVAEVGNGIYQMDINAADLNGDIITFRMTGTDADDTFLTIRTAG